MNKSAPQTSPKTLFFTADFLKRTLEQYSPKLDSAKINANDPDALEAYSDVLGRNTIAAKIVLDRTGGVQKMFTQGVGEIFDFGEEARVKAEELKPGSTV